MCPLGLGHDLIEISRIARALNRHGQRFIDRIFRSEEQTYCLQQAYPPAHFAARFAAKEAIIKALGIGFREGASWLDIEIRKDRYGKPYVELKGVLLKRFPKASILLSMTHCKEYASATALSHA